MLVDQKLESVAKKILKAKFLEICAIPEHALEELFSYFTLETYKKNTHIIRETEPILHIYFIFKGIIRIYFYKNDKLIIERFVKEGGFFGGNYDHLSKYPGVHNYESLEDLVVLKIKHEDLENLYKKHPSIESLYRRQLEAFHFAYVDKLYTLKAANSEERYRDFELEYGDIINRISMKNVASYLNMTAETVSRIRAKQSGNK